MASLPRLSNWKSIFFSIIVFGIIAWLVITIVLLYRYTLSSSTEETNKGGTFIEAITDPISYLPYWGDPEKNIFYQTLLFPGCEGGLAGNLCDIQTEDNKTYSIRIHPNILWSDNTPFTLDDVIFSYQDIVVSNFWQQPYLSKYQDILLTMDENDTDILYITFPSATENNREFFKLPIIPLHIIQDYTLEQYVTNFAGYPVTLGCVQLQKSSDTNSIIFSMAKCTQTNINYYQIKSFDTPDKLQKSIETKKPIVGLYYGSQESPFYNLLDIRDNNYLAFFFNTKSTRLTPRIQRSIAGFINYQFWKRDHSGYIATYDGLLNHYVTTGDNLKLYIEEKNPYLTYDKSLLEQGGVKSLPRIFTLDWAKRKLAFYLDPVSESEYSFSFETTDPVLNIKGTSQHSVRNLNITSDNNNKKYTVTFTVGEGQQIQEGLNTLTLEGTVGGKKQQIASIDIYYLGRTSSQTGDNNINRIKIITLDNKLANYVRTQLQDIFEDHNIQNLFELVVYPNNEKLQEAIKIKDYDMILTNIQIRGLEDIHRILSSSNSEVNPSNYTNTTLNQFLLENNRNQVRNMIASDMPFFVVGQLMKPYRIRNDIVFEYTGSYNEPTLRNTLIQHISLVSHRVFNWKEIFNWNNFIAYIQKEKKPNNDFSSSESVIIEQDFEQNTLLSGEDSITQIEINQSL